MSGEALNGQVQCWYPRCRASLDVILDGLTSGLGSEETPLHVEQFYPRSAKIHSNSYHIPDEWELTFDARDCPFDPALIRLATVQIFLYDAGQMEDPPAGPDALMPMTGEDMQPDIIGLFDDDSMELSDDGRWITVQGQDLTTLFSGKQWPPHANGRAKRLPVGMKLDKFVNDRIQEVNAKGSHAMGVVFDGGLTSADMPTVGKDQPAGHGRGVPVKQNTTYWDVIYQTVIRHGFICYVRGWNIVIANPKNLADYRNADIVKMAWGNNIEHLTLQRKLGKQNVPTVIVVGYDENGQVRKTYSWPDPKRQNKQGKPLSPKVASKIHSVEKSTIKGTTATKTAKAPKAGAKPKTTMVKKDEEFMIVPVHGTWSPDSLLRAAQSLHTLIGRGERRIIVKTHDLTDINGKPLLHLMAGDAAEIHWQDFNSETMQVMNVEERVQFLRAHGYQDDVAQTLALAYDRLRDKANPPMRVREVTKDFDTEGGLSIEMELVDFATASPATPVQAALFAYTGLRR